MPHGVKNITQLHRSHSLPPSATPLANRACEAHDCRRQRAAGRSRRRGDAGSRLAYTPRGRTPSSITSRRRLGRGFVQARFHGTWRGIRLRSNNFHDLGSHVALAVADGGLDHADTVAPAHGVLSSIAGAGHPSIVRSSGRRPLLPLGAKSTTLLQNVGQHG